MKELKDYSTDHINDYEGIPVSELHNELFNTDFYFIYTDEAKKWLNKVGVFEAIECVKEYEQDNFGEVNTDFSDPCKVANMYVYIKGEEILYSLDSFQNNIDSELTEEVINELIEEINE